MEKYISFLTDGLEKAKSNTLSEPSTFHCHCKLFLPYISPNLPSGMNYDIGFLCTDFLLPIAVRSVGRNPKNFLLPIKSSGIGSLSKQIISATSDRVENCSASIAPT